MMDAFKRVALLLLTLLLNAVSVSGVSQHHRSEFVLLKESYSFPYNASICDHAWWRKSFPTVAEIGEYTNQLCSIESNFGADFSCVGNQLLLKKAKSADLGTYVFVCNEAQYQLKLDILYALKVNAVETEDVTLDCTALSDKDVTWLFNNGTALRYKKGGSITPGKGFEGRVSMEKESFRTGNFSLTITDLRSTDEGVYRCFVDQETTKGYPHTYKLHVNKSWDQTDCACTELNFYKTVTVILAVFGAVLTFLLVGVSFLYYKERNNNPTQANIQIPLLQPVQESKALKHESSVTSF